MESWVLGVFVCFFRNPALLYRHTLFFINAPKSLAITQLWDKSFSQLLWGN